MKASVLSLFGYELGRDEEYCHDEVDWWDAVVTIAGYPPIKLSCLHVGAAKCWHITCRINNIPFAAGSGSTLEAAADALKINEDICQVLYVYGVDSALLQNHLDALRKGPER